MARSQGPRKRGRGNIEELRSGALRVRVYAGIDPVSKRQHYLKEVIPAGPDAWAIAEKTLRRLVHQVDEKLNPSTSATLSNLLDLHLEMLDVEDTTKDTYVRYADRHIRPFLGDKKLSALGAELFDSFYAELRRCRDHCDRSARVDHRTDGTHDCDERCAPHVCRPLAAATIRQIHFVLSGALKRAVRMRWISVNPIDQAEPPRAPKPNPKPPTATEAGLILNEAWSDPDWGTLVWLTMVTGMRRGELCGLRWQDVDFGAGLLRLERSVGQLNGRTWEKETKTHQHRRIALDPETLGILADHRNRAIAQAAEVGAELGPKAFVFSLAPDSSTHMRPDTVSQRYAKLARKLGIETSLHKLRHYSATELIAAGVDVRTVAGRLGHGGGGTTTLRVYAAFVSESDQRAAGNLFDRMPTRTPLPESVIPEDWTPTSPYEKVAAALREAIESGEYATGTRLPTFADIAAEHDVSVTTAQRAVSLLKSWGMVDVVSGRRAIVVWSPPTEDIVTAPALIAADQKGPRLLDLEIRQLGHLVSKLTAEADPDDPAHLRKLLLGAVRRNGGKEADLSEFEMVVREAGKSTPIKTFVCL